MKKVVFILGPTGVGKSEIAINLAKNVDGQIISADAVQVFRGFDVGSAKLAPEQMQGVTHYGIDIVSPNQEFSVFDFVNYSRHAIDKICKSGKVPIVVGGTGLYIKSMIEGYNFGDTDKNQDFRAQQQDFAQQFGNLALWQKLERLDKSEAEKIPPNNVKRVIRALEVIKFGSGKSSNEIDFEPLVFALTLDREKLYQKINARVDIMVKNGLFEEVEGLLKSGVSLASQPMQAIGYKEVASALNGTLTHQQAIDLVKQHTRNYAKRQMTFIRGMKGVQIVDAQDRERANKTIIDSTKKFLEENHEG